jgi:hypothetical protein
MKRKILLATLATLAISFNAQAGTPVGYESYPHEGNGGQPDPLLTGRAIDQALLEGLRSAGVAVDANRRSPVVTFDYFLLYSPQASNLRVLSGSLALREDVVVKGKRQRVGLCSFETQTWRVGPSVQMHVAAILDAVRDYGERFAKDCLK